MESEIKNVQSHVAKIMQVRLSKRGLSISQGRLMDTILEFLAKNENEILRMIEKKKNYEVKLKKWLQTPVDAERTNALKEHELVV